jgi:hypothetical protein
MIPGLDIFTAGGAAGPSSGATSSADARLGSFNVGGGGDDDARVVLYAALGVATLALVVALLK